MATKEELLGMIDNSIEDTHTWIDDVLSKLGWSKDYLFQKDIELVSCPINPGHKMPRSSLDTHMKYCPLLSKGYSREELDTMYDPDYCYENSNVVIIVTIDENEFKEVMRKCSQSQGGHSLEIPEMPVTVERAEKTLSREQRLALHEYIVEKAKKVRPKPILCAEDLTLLEDVKKGDDSVPKSRLELLAMQRDLKRRRQSYRAKNVHITKKSYTEILREVIENQMEAWVAVTTDSKESERPEKAEQSYDRRSHDNRRLGDDRRSQDRREKSRSIQRDRHSYQREESPARSRKRSRDRSRDRSPERYSRRSPDSRRSRSKRSRERSSSREQYSHKRHRRESRSRSRERRSQEKIKSREVSREPSYSSRPDDQDKRERYDSDSDNRSSKKHKKHKKHKHHKKKDK